MRPIPLPVTAPVKGVSFHADAVSRVRVGMDAEILRDPENAFDKHACQVIVDSELVGYLPKELAERMWVRPEANWSGYVSEILEGEHGIGLRVTITTKPANGLQLQLPKTSEEPLVDEPMTDPRTVVAKSGRILGRYLSDEGDKILIQTEAGQKVAYPKTLVDICEGAVNA